MQTAHSPRHLLVSTLLWALQAVNNLLRYLSHLFGFLHRESAFTTLRACRWHDIDICGTAHSGECTSPVFRRIRSGHVTRFVRLSFSFDHVTQRRNNRQYHTQSFREALVPQGTLSNQNDSLCSASSLGSRPPTRPSLAHADHRSTLLNPRPLFPPHILG